MSDKDDDFYDKIKKKRKEILKGCPPEKRRIVSVGNSQVKSLRHCSVCGKPLTELLPDETNHFRATHKHYYLKLGYGLNFSLCYEGRSCLRYLNHPHNTILR